MSKGAVKNKTSDLPKIRCLGACDRDRTASVANFYANVNPLFAAERLNVCKDCILSFLGDKDSQDHLDRVYLVLALLNKPFILTKWEECDGEWSKYIPQVSSLNQHRGQSFRNSDWGIIKIVSNNKESSTSESSEKDNESSVNFQDYIRDLIDFWGAGLENDEYEFLQKEFTKLVNSYECDSYAMEMIFQEVSHLRLSIKKLRENNKPVDKELKTLQDLLGSANIKPVQETGANSVEQATFGTLIKKYENERPIPEPDPMWKDVDKIGHYIKIWFFGHFAKMLGLKSEDSEEYEEELKKYTVDAPEYEDEGVIEEWQE